jgi:hypothetical protein
MFNNIFVQTEKEIKAYSSLIILYLCTADSLTIFVPYTLLPTVPMFNINVCNMILFHHPLKADFHSVENVARSTFPREITARFFKCISIPCSSVHGGKKRVKFKNKYGGFQQTGCFSQVV